MKKRGWRSKAEAVRFLSRTRCQNCTQRPMAWSSSRTITSLRKLVAAQRLSSSWKRYIVYCSRVSTKSTYNTQDPRIRLRYRSTNNSKPSASKESSSFLSGNGYNDPFFSSRVDIRTTAENIPWVFYNCP